MSWLGETWRKFSFLLRRRQMERDLAEEMREHAALKARKNVAAGMLPEEAASAAQRQLGNLTRHREESRQSWGFPFLESIGQDVHYGLRGLRNAPGFTVVAALTLALGIGACTAIFSIVNAVLLRPLPYKDSSRMVHVWTVSSMFPDFQMGQSILNVTDIKALSHSFAATTIYIPGRKDLTGRGDPEQLEGAAVTSDFFDFFGVHPAQGREFVVADEQRKNGDVVLLSYGLWQRRFAADPKIIGASITLEQRSYTVVGVMPKGFSYPEKTDLWAPLVLDAKEQTQRMSWRYFMLGKLRADVSLKHAQAEIDGIAASVGRQHPDEAAGIKFPLMTLQATSVGETKAELLALTGAVGFLLLIACANVSNLVLSRGFKRQREVSVRAALGASRSRIVRQLLIENLLLALGGGVAGATFAVVGVAAFRILAPKDFPRLAEVNVEPMTVLIAFGLTAFTGILFGLAPALSASRADLNLALKEKTSTGTARRFSLRGLLVVTETASALILLTGSALMVQSMVRILKVDTGLRIERVLSATLTLPKVRYGTDDAFRLFAQKLLDELRAQPGFTRVALSDTAVMKGGMSLMALDRPTLAEMGLKDERVDLETRTVSPGFFETLGVPIVRGRSFNEHDGKGAPNATVINDSMARRFFPGQDAIGRILKLDKDPAYQFQVVGQVADTLDVSLQARPQLQIYFCLQQGSSSDSLNILVQTPAEPAVAVESIRRAVASVDRDVPLDQVQSITESIQESVAQPRFRAWLLSAFAFAGLALTLIGIYGVISYSVGQRTQEMGIRMALGAQRWNVLRLILREGALLALAGAICGLVGSFFLMWMLASQLYGIKPTDPVTLAGAAVLMLVVALAASYIPARRATRVDPMVALRYE